MAGVIKKYLPEYQIIFLGRDYTKPVIELSSFVDEFISWDDIRDLSLKQQTDAFREMHADTIIHVFQVWEITKLAFLSGIRLRVGTTHRLFTWFYCNRLVWFSRKQSGFHEAQLNLKLLRPIGINVMLSREEIRDYYGLRDEGRGSRVEGQGSYSSPGPSPIREEGNQDQFSKFRLILHPKSKGSAREWGLENFSRLIEMLPQDKYEIFITGTDAEGSTMKDFLVRHKEQVTDMTGKLTLPELLQFIQSCDGLVAASTGPLHLAAAFGKVAVGIYAPMRPIYPTRWAPLGNKAGYLVMGKKCNDCRKTLDCHCMKEITAESVVKMLRTLNI